MPETETKKEEKNATAPKAQTVTVEAGPAKTETAAPPKTHRKSNYVMLAPGQSETMSLFASFTNSTATVALYPKHGQVYKLVDDATDEPNTISRPMGLDYLNKGLLVYADAPDKDAPPFVPTHAPETPQGDMIANGILSGENVGSVAVSVNGGKEQVFVPAPFVTTPDGGVIPVAPQPGFPSSSDLLVETAKTERE